MKKNFGCSCRYARGSPRNAYTTALPSWSVQLENSLLWLTGNKSEGVMTPYGYARQNRLWMPQVGITRTLNK